MNKLQQAHVESIQQARANVTFTITESGPIAHNYSGVRRNLSAGTVYMDADMFPTITIGPKGGIQVWISSYPEGNGKTAYDAAIVADVLLAKQQARKMARDIAARPDHKGQALLQSVALATLASATEEKTSPRNGGAIETVLVDAPSSTRNGKREHVAR